MNRVGWGRTDDPSDARTRLLDAAGKVFAVSGVLATNMTDVATEAGCSRGTLYRYFPDADALRQAFVEREARRVGAEVLVAVEDIDDPTERLVEAVVASLGIVGADPVLAAWFDPASAGVAGSMAMSTDVVRDLVGAVVAELPPSADHDPSRQATVSEAVVRLVVSFLAQPAPEATVRAVIGHVVGGTLRA